MQRYFFIVVLATLVCCVLSARAAQAQTIYGSISGVVTDQRGATISGVKVTATNAATGAAREAFSNQEGMYRIAGLPIGAYSVKVEITGFQQQVIERVEVSVAVDSAANFTLGAGAVQEVVTVTETAALLETTQSQVSKVVDSARILELPGRNNLNGLALLNPGVLPNQNGRPGSGFAVNGNRTRSITC